jgi:carboxylesterase
VPLTEGAEPFMAQGDRLGILVLHGFRGSPVSVRGWAQHLATAGHTVAAPRLPGHGTRWQDLNRTTWQHWYTEAERNLEWLADRSDTVMVMGLSNGATLALRLAEQRPDVAGLVCVNPQVHSERPERNLLGALARVVPAVPAATNDIKKPGMQEGAYDRLPLRAARSLTSLWTVVKSDIHKVSVPLLVIRSADDHVVEPSNSMWIMANVASPDVRELVLQDSFHVATLDNDAEQVYEASREFAEEVAQS